jgi:tetratricopeptide (TPR) repeat protein
MGEPSSNEESKARATHISNKSALVSVLRRRSKKTKTDENYLETSSYHASLDDAIRGRLDGMDVLSLGPARLPCFVAVKTDDTPIEKFLRALNPRLTAASLVKDMIYTSAGRSPPEMILEGFFDRWFVKIHLDPEILIPSPSKDETCGSAVCGGDASLDNLVERMWGKHQPPPQEESNENEKDVLQLAAECNVPIDLDEDSFIIETHQHWQAVHDILCIPLGRGDFESALTILGKILQGQSHPQHQAATRHNMALVYMWQNNYSAALAFLEQAVALRNLSVSLFRQGLCLWALGRLDMAITCLRQALDKHPAENATRAKLCNNIGVLFYSRGNLMQALEYFTKALEMQRQWLDCKVKRESIIFDASTTLNNMGKLYLNKKDYDAAEVVFEEALVVSELLLFCLTLTHQSDLRYSFRQRHFVRKVRS